MGLEPLHNSTLFPCLCFLLQVNPISMGLVLLHNITLFPCLCFLLRVNHITMGLVLLHNITLFLCLCFLLRVNPITMHISLCYPYQEDHLLFTVGLSIVSLERELSVLALEGLVILRKST